MTGYIYGEEGEGRGGGKGGLEREIKKIRGGKEKKKGSGCQ